MNEFNPLEVGNQASELFQASKVHFLPNFIVSVALFVLKGSRLVAQRLCKFHKNCASFITENAICWVVFLNYVNVQSL